MRSRKRWLFGIISMTEKIACRPVPWWAYVCPRRETTNQLFVLGPNHPFRILQIFLQGFQTGEFAMTVPEMTLEHPQLAHVEPGISPLASLGFCLVVIGSGSFETWVCVKVGDPNNGAFSLCRFSRKHGEGFFRWVHLSCSHESHYKVSLQGIIIMKVIARSHGKESLQGVMARSHGKESLQGVIARSHCKESLQGVIARSHGKESLQGVIARSHCKESLQGVIARSHCKESWQGLQLALDSLHLQLALDSLHLQLALDSMHLQLALDSMHLAPCTWLLALGPLHLQLALNSVHLRLALDSMHLAPCNLQWLS